MVLRSLRPHGSLGGRNAVVGDGLLVRFTEGHVIRVKQVGEPNTDTGSRVARPGFGSWPCR